MAGARPHRNPIYAGDFRKLRGRAWVLTDRDHTDGTPVYRVAYLSGGGDIFFKSKPIAVAEHADAACRVFLRLRRCNTLDRIVFDVIRANAMANHRSISEEIAARLAKGVQIENPTP